MATDLPALPTPPFSSPPPAPQVKTPALVGPIHYPESDGKPMAENTLQLRWIMVLVGNLMALFREAADVFVGGNQNWYPVEGRPDVVQAPDAYVVFGRPKGHRPSWKQWEEDHTPLTVAVEVLSPGNSDKEMADKLAFYDEHGVEEYYVLDPDRHTLKVYTRGKQALVRRRFEGEYASPRLGVRFVLGGAEWLSVHHPGGAPFLTFEQLTDEVEKARKQADEAQTQADQARKQADEARRAGLVYAQRLAELGRRARRGQATPDEMAELERLEDEVQGV